MTEHVISHRRARRKRASAWGWAARRLGALAVTIGALVTATWLAPLVNAPEPKLAAPTPRPEPPPVVVKWTGVIKDFAAAAPAAAPPRPVRRAVGVPLDAAADAVTDGFEVLNAAELAAISQARD